MKLATVPLAIVPRVCPGCQGLTHGFNRGLNPMLNPMANQVEEYCSACTRLRSEYEAKLALQRRERAADLQAAERANALFRLQPRMTGLLPASEELARRSMGHGLAMGMLFEGCVLLFGCLLWVLLHGGHALWALWTHWHWA